MKIPFSQKIISIGKEEVDRQAVVVRPMEDDLNLEVDTRPGFFDQKRMIYPAVYWPFHSSTP